ncbi:MULTISPECIES: Y-family DNA polymerase [Carnobacterium]|uniref:UV-damage repair protein uvrX n=2 Tax=Carnobacterium inhibens TaxID=147709 RepID=U5S8T2_9LACT|nr:MULTISPECIES: Y-family DNA polymerase [Carnobacterium]AGY81659.1 UV-damage repair protein uvrX [Carnobacterium inhibens subsp. gilichinskyi]MBC9824814.1 excinuclease ABC subunit A [Carnobacterium inhibens]MDN5372417.1 polymerase [Carnobacterium sp.]
MSFNYAKEISNDIFCIDVKSFYASVECVERGLHPLKALLVVMSNADKPGGIVLAASPMAKKVLGIRNVTRKWEIPYHPDLVIVPPRMSYYIEKNTEINDIFRKYVSDEDLHIYSIDESFISVRGSLKLFKRKSSYELARMIQYHIFKKTGLYVTIGIGDNMLMAKLALDNEAKYNKGFIAEWRYKDVPNTVWKLEQLTDMWGIGSRTARRLNSLGIKTVYDLAHSNFYQLRDSMGLIGEQLYANAWGIDRSDIRDSYRPLEKSYGNSQILKKDYYKKHEIKIVIREMAEQVATRIRKHHCQTGCVSLSVSYSKYEEQVGFSRQLKIPSTSNTKKLVDSCFEIFNKYYEDDKAVRRIGITYSKLSYTSDIQLDLFEDPTEQITNEKLDLLVDKIREKYGFQSLVHASSLMDGATAIDRSSLVGGHAGGMEGIK